MFLGTIFVTVDWIRNYKMLYFLLSLFVGSECYSRRLTLALNFIVIAHKRFIVSAKSLFVCSLKSLTIKWIYKTVS